MLAARIDHIALLRYAGFFTYACVGLPLVVETLHPAAPIDPFHHGGWIASYLSFGASYWALMRDLGRPLRAAFRLLWLTVMTASAIAINYFSASGLAAILLLVIAGVLPWMLPPAAGIAWLIAATLSFVPVFVLKVEGYGWFDAIFQSGLYLGFSSFTFATSLVAKGQAEAREEQRRLNAELRATRVLLAESTRVNERTRISRELHDLLGHHLTALSINLEVASHLVEGKAKEHVLKAQQLARLLLADVREVVSQLRQDEALDLESALAALVEGVPEPRIHLDFEPGFRVDDARRAQVLLRCAQETITNAIRHARARNLWLRFYRTADGALALDARDDGHGAAQWAAGNGLNGMRERLARAGGTLDVQTAPGKGFALAIRLPQEAVA
jgi:signal transduction histidine kinase